MIHSTRYIFVLMYFLLPHHLLSLLMNTSWLPLKLHDFCALILLFLLPSKLSIDAPIKFLATLIILYVFRSFFSQNLIDSLLVSIKLIEYLVVIMSIKSLPSAVQNRLFKIFYIFIMITFLLYIFNFDLGPSWGPRFFGHFGGPYEISTILLYIILCKHHPFQKNYSFSMVLNFVVLWFTYTKAVLLSILLSRPLLIVASVFFAMTTSIIISLSTTENRLIDLFVDLSNFTSLPIIDLCMAMPTFENSEEYNSLFQRRNDFNINELTVSTSHRFFTVCSIWKNMGVIEVLFGFDPLFFGTIDNSVLRVFTDVGILGVILAMCLVNYFLGQERFLIKFAFIVSLALSDVFFSGRFIVSLYLMNNIRRKKNEKNLNY